MTARRRRQRRHDPADGKSDRYPRLLRRLVLSQDPGGLCGRAQSLCSGSGDEVPDRSGGRGRPVLLFEKSGAATSGNSPPRSLPDRHDGDDHTLRQGYRAVRAAGGGRNEDLWGALLLCRETGHALALRSGDRDRALFRGLPQAGLCPDGKCAVPVHGPGGGQLCGPLREDKAEFSRYPGSDGKRAGGTCRILCQDGRALRHADPPLP